VVSVEFSLRRSVHTCSVDSVIYFPGRIHSVVILYVGKRFQPFDQPERAENSERGLTWVIIYRVARASGMF